MEHSPASACTEGWSCVLRSWAWMVSTTLLNLRLGPAKQYYHMCRNDSTTYARHRLSHLIKYLITGWRWRCKCQSPSFLPCLSLSPSLVLSLLQRKRCQPEIWQASGRQTDLQRTCTLPGNLSERSHCDSGRGSKGEQRRISKFESSKKNEQSGFLNWRGRGKETPNILKRY